MARLSMHWLLPMLLFCGASSSSSSRIASSYCTNAQCPYDVLVSEGAALNQVSATSFFLNGSGALQPCSADVGSCGWTGDVEAFNAGVPGATGGAVRAAPLLFMNSGTTVASFRALLRAEGGTATVIRQLSELAADGGYAMLSLDLEPSCWASNASACEWPTAEDTAAFRSFVDDLADALHGISHAASPSSPSSSGINQPPVVGLSVAAAGFPATQCDGGYREYEEFCELPNGASYAVACAAGLYNVSTCNCCAFTQWFDLDSLCGSKADRIVNMDTYLDVFNESLFDDAMAYYVDHGCAGAPGGGSTSSTSSTSTATTTHGSGNSGRLAAGLLVAEGGASDADVAAVFAALEKWAVEEIDVWVNFWVASNNVTLDLWRPHLEAWLQQGD